MGRNWKSRRNRKRKLDNQSGNATQTKKPVRVDYDDIVKENALFEQYYKSQNIVDEDQWTTFMTTLRQPLPASFRITDNGAQSRVLLSVVKRTYLDLAVSESGERPVCLPWYPHDLAWQLSLTRTDIRRSEVHQRLHSFLVAETECGHISRQETVSMIPPLLLDVQSHHKVLDMCAAPGSKTAQLIEGLHRATSLPTGVVVANDADNSRCYMLVHQAKRRPTPCFIITNHDAAHMPNFYMPAAATHVPGDMLQEMKFDRVLCDVPCSGDGTLRKNVDVWPKWNPINGVNLHGLQFNIARRGVQLLDIGGRVVYSTCSLNPVENEAVVARLLDYAQGSVELVDASDLVPGLKFSPGLTHWTPFTKDMRSYSCASDVPQDQHTILRPHMFPPENQTILQQLTLCMRILPHHQNTGGFFVAVLQKTAAVPDEAPVMKPARLIEKSRSKTATRTRGHKENPYFFTEPRGDLATQLDDFFHLSASLDISLFMTRSEGDDNNDTVNNDVNNDTVNNDTVNNDTVNNDTVNNDTVNNDTVNNDTVNNDTVNNEVNNDTVNNDTVNNDTVNNDTVNNDTVNNDTVNNDTVNNDTVNNDTVNNDTVNNDTVNNDTVNNDTVNNDTVNNDTVNNDTVNNDTVNNDTVNNDTVNNDTVNNDTVNNEVNNDTVNNDTVNNDTVNNDTVNNDTVNNDTVNNDTVNNDTVITDTVNNDTVNNDTVTTDTVSTDMRSGVARGSHKHVYLCSQWARCVLQHNQGRLRVINAGLKVFSRCHNKMSPCPYRLTQEGTGCVLAHVRHRQAELRWDDMVSVLQCGDVDRPATLTTLHETSQRELDRHDVGSIVLVSEVVSDVHVARVHVVGWLGNSSLRGYVARAERVHLLRLLGADTSKFERNKFTGKGDVTDSSCEIVAENQPMTS